ncbi:hypothetical protein [Ohtaekwangia koreensis]|uniref:Immunity protein 17 n=1 Tax=Ohtaekwangia koreensis TaxID=688867 RepID=A0A1T5LJ41_9BACT|nr:hypothetical protein [Ohtaekwangia koreensis]SKC75987.1 hypothetical protein SAMN05660236_3327 [Ohtaekwangia koreensis]
MNFVQQLLLYISITAFAFLVIGLYKPWAMLWWEDVQNRRKVIKLYGGIASTSYIVYWLMFFIIK